MTTHIRKASAGVISGFNIDLSTTDTNINITPTVYTIDDALAEIQKIRQVLDPENIRRLQERIFQHTLDRSNPHHTTIGDLILDVTRDALLDYMPGTTPNTAPTYALIAALSDCTDLITERTTPVLALDATGHLIEIPPHQPVIDWSSGHPRLMAWAARQNLLTSSNPINNPVVNSINATLYTQNISSLKAPDRSIDYLIVKDLPTESDHGIKLTIPVEADIEYVSSLYIYPWKTAGHITLSLGSDEAIIRINISTGIITSSDNIIAHFEVYPTGWWRVGLQYVSVVTGDQTLTVLYNQDDTSVTYVGQEEDIFLVAGMMHGEGIGLGPYIPTTNGSVTVASTTYTIPLSEDVIGRNAGMMSITATLQKSLKSTSQPILSVTPNALSLERESNTVEFTLDNSGPTLITPFLNGSVFKHAYSYDTNTMRQLGTSRPRQSVSGTYGTLSEATLLTLYPSDTAFDSIMFYGQAENGYALDFLTGINSQ